MKRSFGERDAPDRRAAFAAIISLQLEEGERLRVRGEEKERGRSAFRGAKRDLL